MSDTQQDGAQQDNTQHVQKSAIAQKEEKTQKWWEEQKIFEQSLQQESPQGEYVFYDGPPFATGLPHYGHILASAVKDMIPRYMTMRGFHVERRWGWDTHGLPIENIVEKDLGVAGKKQIEQLGVEKFNEYARSKVFSYVHDWKKTVERMGRWVDFDGSYKTLDNSYIESVWWALGELNKKGVIYESTRVLPYCPRCETPIANSEIAMDNSYKDIKDISVYVRFRITNPSQILLGKSSGQHDVYMLAWTTTPWTLPGNFALAISRDLAYVTVRVKKDDTEQRVVIAKERIEPVLLARGYEIEIEAEYTGQDLIDLSYEPIFPYFYGEQYARFKEVSWKIYAGDFVTAQSGTGIVHIAPGYGEDDMLLAKKHNILWKHHVNAEGAFTEDVKDFAGLKVKPKPAKKEEGGKDTDHQVTDILIIKYLAAHGALFAKENIVHSYPHCYRCETPLYYFAIPAWFINIQHIREELLNKNQDIHWVPEHLKEGRFLRGLEGAPDWNISRNRFWASPLPIWKSEVTGEVEFIPSLSALMEKTNRNNRIFLMRHGEAENNTKHIVSADPQAQLLLTEQGTQQVEITAKHIAAERSISRIYVSPVVRTKMTAEIVRKVLGLTEDQVVVDDRLREVGFGELEGISVDDYHTGAGKQAFSLEQAFDHAHGGGETLTEVRTRVGEALFDIYSKHQDEEILIITHATPLWLLESVASRLDRTLTIQKRHTDQYSTNYYIENAGLREVDFRPYPHNVQYELDMHRPYIDSITYTHKDGSLMKRIPEVIDCWFESGAMPFAAEHYPFNNANDSAYPVPESAKRRKNTKEIEQRMPADFVCEYLPQTRTWFYYMHVLSTYLFGQAPFKHVVTTGTVLAEDGQKMSKSKNNFPDPWVVFNTYGVDALRYYLLASPLMKAEDFSFSEKDLDIVYKKMVMRMDNVVSFLTMYEGVHEQQDTHSAHTVDILDEWILARLHEVNAFMMTELHAYRIETALRPLDLLIDDISTWYVRRSRDRFKQDNHAREVFRSVLHTTSLLLAPIMPFLAERIFGVVRYGSDPISVHLMRWPDIVVLNDTQKQLLQAMTAVRESVSTYLEARTKTGIKVRQPLASLVIVKHEKTLQFVENASLLEIIQDELNVKHIEVVENSELLSHRAQSAGASAEHIAAAVAQGFYLDTVLSPELVLEGKYRDLIRMIQDQRKNLNLSPKDIVGITLPETQEYKEILEQYRAELSATVGAREITISQQVDKPTVKI